MIYKDDEPGQLDVLGRGYQAHHLFDGSGSKREGVQNFMSVTETLVY
jgi:hypothetical protein